MTSYGQTQQQTYLQHTVYNATNMTKLYNTEDSTVSVSGLKCSIYRLAI